MSNTINSLIEKYGSDKTASGYSSLYQQLFSSIRSKTTTLLEIGVGTMQPEIPSSFKGNLGLYPHYKPGGSLRAWRDYFEFAKIYGMDVAEDCRIFEDRIETVIASSLDTFTCNEKFQDNSLDIIIDDGLHTAIGQLYTLYNFFPKVANDGLYVIEDCGGGGDNKNIFVEFAKQFKEIADEHEYFFRENILFIRKSYSKRGQIFNFEEFCNLGTPVVEMTSNLTIVSGLWNINRIGRDFTHYIENFKKFLNIPVNMFLYLPKDLEYLVWENPQRNKTNTHVRIFELSDIKNNLYAPFWDKTQEIRTSSSWYNKTGEHGWLKGSPQATLEYYNPIVQSKMFMLHDAKIMNVFDTDYFLWLDAGITNTVSDVHLIDHRCFDKIIPLLKTFLFLSYPYEATDEIHGFDFQEMNRIARQQVKYVCRGGLFGGHKDFVTQANSTYYALLQQTLDAGLMGTEESIFSIMTHLEPHIYRRYALDGNGLISKFASHLVDDAVILETVTSKILNFSRTSYNSRVDKTSLYVLGFNFPDQFRTLLESFEKHPVWLKHPRKILINNSTDQSVMPEYEKLCTEYGFEHIITGENLGINRGRLLAAKHFEESDSNYYFFFEDDMCLHEPDLVTTCRNGFKQSVPNLYKTVHEIMARDALDFLKLSYTEVYMDNNIQVSWYNVPQVVRSNIWPEYDQLPISGLDPHAPRTKFNRIENYNDISYAIGEVYYANWPMIVSREGNKKMFLNTDWANPYEQTWMSHMFQETIAGRLTPAVLLASPINHNRIFHYLPEVRREN
jgi:hypothetical protein